MTAAHWSAFAIAALLSLGAVLYLYRRREPAGRGRMLLATLRWCALALLILLLFDPRLKRPVDRAAARRAPVLVDASLSMLLPASASSSRWQVAVAEAKRRAGTAGVILFGDEARALSSDSMSAVSPYATWSRLLPALQSAAEAGATTVTVITDGDIEDGDAVARWLPRLGLHVEWVTSPEGLPNTSFAEISAPSWAESGKPVPVQVGVVSTGGADSVHIVLRQDGRVIGTHTVARPAPGRVANATIEAQPRAPAGGGMVRIEATADASDVFEADNVRNVYVHVSDEPAGVVLVSLAPDWEPRFLLPVLERAVGLPVRGYLHGTDGMWLRAGGGIEAGKRVADAVVQRALANADLVVIHNAGEDVPAWVRSALTDASRLIVLPAPNAAGLPLPVELSAAAPDDWFVSPDIPPSPVAPLLAGLQTDDTPPLESIQLAGAPPGSWAPLVATRGRRGRPAPLALAGESGGRRWAVALGSGYWRWAFRGGASRDVYDRLWSSVGGWLMRDGQAAEIAAVRPAHRVVLRGESLAWVTRLGALDSVRVKLTPSAGGPARDTVLTAERDTALMTGVAPGTYRYNATAFSHGVEVAGTGELTVETYSPEFGRTRADLASVAGRATRLGNDARARETRPLHAFWMPYVLLLSLLAAEWILRRRWGLR